MEILESQWWKTWDIPKQNEIAPLDYQKHIRVVTTGFSENQQMKTQKVTGGRAKKSAV